MRFLLIILRIVTLFSPLRVFLPISVASFAIGAGYAVWTIATQSHVTNSSVLLIMLAVIVFLVGLVSEQISALRFEGRAVGAMPHGRARPRSPAVLAAVAAGFVLRLAFGLLYWTGKPLTHDEREYLALAGSVAAGRGFVYDASFEAGTGQQFGRAPGYPLFLAAIGARAASACRGDAAARQDRAGAASARAGVWLIGLLARPRRRCRAPASRPHGIAAIYPPLVSMPAYVLSETLYSHVALSAALVVCRPACRPTTRMRRRLRSATVSAARSPALAALDPARDALLPAACGCGLAVRDAPATRLALAFCPGGAAWSSLPWTVRNVRVYDRFVLIASEGGVTFWTGNHPLAIGEGDLAANPEIKRAELEFRRAHPGLTPKSSSRSTTATRSRTFERAPRLVDAPARAQGVLHSWCRIGPSYALHSTRYRAASAASYLLLLPFAVGGCTAARARDRSRRRRCSLLAGSAVLVCLSFFRRSGSGFP